MKEKKLPPFISNRYVYGFFQSRPGRILSNWVFQGMLYMNSIEIVYKLLLDVVLTIAWMTLLLQDWTLSGGLLALILAHTTNWIINGQPVALLYHLDWGGGNANHFIGYIENLKQRIDGRSYIGGAASFGSLSKGKYGVRSDIDIRFLLPENTLGRWQLAHYCFVERFRAFIHWFPLDLYAFDLEQMKKKMNPDEIPVIFYDPGKLVTSLFNETRSFEEFSQSFRQANLKEDR